MGLHTAVVVQQQSASKSAGLVVRMSGYAEKFEHSFWRRFLPRACTCGRRSVSAFLQITTKVVRVVSPQGPCPCSLLLVSPSGGTCCSDFLSSLLGLQGTKTGVPRSSTTVVDKCATLNRLCGV